MHKETSKKQNQAHLHQLKKFPNGTSTRKIKSISGLDQQMLQRFSDTQTLAINWLDFTDSATGKK